MLTIVDYNAGNLRSVQRACDAVGLKSVFTQDPEFVRKAERLVFPGVGNAESAMATLNATGLGEALRGAYQAGTPILGICVGAQLILDSSEESQLPCLGLIAGKTRRFPTEQALDSNAPRLKVPHIGWNEVKRAHNHFLLEELEPGDEFYFVHSYYPDPDDPAHVYAFTDYGKSFCCALGKDNLFATQFHPEKSGRLGLQLLARFSRWSGSC